MGLESFLPETPQGNATAADVLTGYTFSSAAAGVGVSGSMPNQGSISQNLAGQPGKVTGAAGYYSSILVENANYWLLAASDTTARSGIGAAYDSSANLTYAVDGYTTTGIATVTAYSHPSNAWTAEASDTTARYGLAAAYDSSANLTYAIDGATGGFPTVTAYSHLSNAWTAEASDTTARTYLGAAYDSSANLTYAVDGSPGSGTIFIVTAYAA